MTGWAARCSFAHYVVILVCAAVCGCLWTLAVAVANGCDSSQMCERRGDADGAPMHRLLGGIALAVVEARRVVVRQPSSISWRRALLTFARILSLLGALMCEAGDSQFEMAAFREDVD